MTSAGAVAVPLAPVPKNTLQAELLADRPGLVTAFRIPDSQAMNEDGFLEFSYTEIWSILRPRPAAPPPPLPGPSDALAALTAPRPGPSLPALPQPGPGPHGGGNRYSNIIEKLERKYCGSRTALVEDDDAEEQQPKEKRRKKKNKNKKTADPEPSSAPGAAGPGDESEVEEDDYYDSEDSFIDDSAADHDIQSAYNMKKVQTKRSGFFVSAGNLEVSSPVVLSVAVPVAVPATEDPAVEKKGAKSPAKSSINAINTIKKAMKRRMVSLTHGRFPDEIAPEIHRGVELCKRRGDTRWFLNELVDILKPTGLTSLKLKHGIKESAMSVDKKQNLNTRVTTATGAIKARLQDKLMSVLSRDDVAQAASAIRLASAGHPLPEGASVQECYLQIWKILWEEEDMLTALHQFQDVCQDWATQEADDRIAKEALAKTEGAPVGGDDPTLTVPAYSAHAASIDTATDPTVPVADVAQSYPDAPLMQLDDAALEARVQRTKLLFGARFRRWVPTMCTVGFQAIKHACGGGADTGGADEATLAAEKTIIESFVTHLKSLHKQRNIAWGLSQRTGKKRPKWNESEPAPSETKTKLNREALGPEISKKKTPKKRITLPTASSTTAAMTVPAAILRTPGAVVTSPSSGSGYSRVIGGPAENGQPTVNNRVQPSPSPSVQTQPRFSTFLVAPPDFNLFDFDK